MFLKIKMALFSMLAALAAGAAFVFSGDGDGTAIGGKATVVGGISLIVIGLRIFIKGVF